MSREKPQRTYSRRQFFPMLVHETIAAFEMARGTPVGHLSALQGLSAEQMGAVVPKCNAEFEIRVVDDIVYAHHRQTGNDVRLFPTDSDALVIFNTFNGHNSINMIVDLFVYQHGFERDAAYDLVRTVFLELAEHMVVLPRDPMATES